jgi:hypothetical protein
MTAREAGTEIMTRLPEQSLETAGVFKEAIKINFFPLRPDILKI